MDDEELEEVYCQWKREVLKDLRQFLVDNLEPQKLFTYLRSRQVMDCDDQEEIEGERVRRRKNERLLDLISSRGPEGFDTFCEAIRRNTTQTFILTKILNEFQKKKDSSLDHSESQESNTSAEDSRVVLPVPGGPGGPIIPFFEDNISVTNGLFVGARARSPPPAYTEF